LPLTRPTLAVIEGGLVTSAVVDEPSLLGPLDWLHDEIFDLDSVVFDPDAHSWSGVFLTPTKQRLSLSNVVGYELHDRSRIARYHFNECRCSPAGCHLLFHEDMDFVLQFDGPPSGSFDDLV
jgi:hypothetical protein